MDGVREALAVPRRRDRVTDPLASFEALVTAHLDRAYRLAAVILGSAVEAEDAVADAALQAWRGRGGLRQTDRFEAWFGRIVVNVCRDRLRSRRRQPVAEVIPTNVDLPAPATDFREAVHGRDELARAFERLAADDRIVLVLRFWLDLPVDEIANRLDIPAGTVKSRLHHATARLRTALSAAKEPA